MARRRIASIFSLSTLLLFWPGSFRAQPVTVPDANLQNFQSQDLQAPQDTQTQLEWEAEAARLRAEYFAQWEAEAQLELDRLFQNTTLPADAFQGQGAYGDFLATSQRFGYESAAAQFEISAEIEMALRREAFMGALIQAQSQTNDEARSQIIGQMKSLLGGSTDYLTDRTKAAMDAKAKQFATQTEEDLAKGLNEYTQALSGLEVSRNDFYEQLAAATQRFEDGLDRIEVYEATVRSGIDSALPGLEAYLADNDQFYEMSCDGASVCTADRSRMTAAGTELSTLIAQMKQALAADAPISALALQMTDFLERQEAAAAGTESYWESQIVRAGDRLGDETMAGGGGVRQEGLLVPATWADTLTAHSTNYRHSDPAKQALLDNPNTLPGAILKYLQGDSSYLQAILKPADHYVVENLSGVDLCGAGGAPPIGFPGPLEHKDGCVSSAGLFGALSYVRLGFLPWPTGIIPLFSIREEEQWVLKGSYTLRDTNAESNRDLWRGYKGQIGAAARDWRNNLLPAIQNWETQAAEYRADYAAWQAEADAKRNEFDASYRQSVNTILLNRQQFLERTTQEIENGKRELAVLAKKAQDMQNAQEEEARIEAEIKKTAVSPARAPTNSFQVPSPGALSAEFLSRAKDGPLASRSAEDVAKSFQSSLRGSLNIAVQSQYSQDAKDTAAAGVRELSAMLGGPASRASAADINASLLSGYIDYFNERSRKPTPIFEIGLAKVGFIDVSALKSAGEETTIDAQYRALARELGVVISASGSVSEGDQNAVLEAAAARKREKLADARAQTEKSLNEYRDRMAWKSVEVLEDGRIKAVRQMATGAVRLKAGGDATNTADYEVITEDQVLYLTGPGAVKLAGSTGLFDSAFNLANIAEESAKAQENYQKSLQNSADRLAQKQVESDELSNQMYAAAQSAISAQAEMASKLQDLVVTVLSGGTLGSWLKSQVQGALGQAFEDLTGFPSGILSNLMGGMRLDKAITKGITDRAKQMAFAEIDKATGLSGAGAFMMEKFEKSQASKKSHASQRGLNALNPSNFQHTTVGKAMMNSNNPLVTAAAAGMTGNPMLLNAALFQTANLAMPDGMRAKVAKTMDKAGKWMENNDGTVARAVAATAIAAGSSPQMMSVGLAALAGKSTEAAGQFMRSTSRVVATGSQTIQEAQDAIHERYDYDIKNAVEIGNARLEARRQKYEQMTLGSGLQELMSPVSELAKVLSKPVPQKSDAQIEFETSLANGWAEVSGWPKEFTRSMFVDGANMEEAFIAQAYGNLNAVIPGAAQEVQEYLARRDLKNKRAKASRIKPEDFATGGLTYAWRNAEYHKDGAIALQVAETTAAVAANVIPGAGQAASSAIFAYMAGKQVYHGSLHGGTKGALAGAVSGAISGLAGMGGAPISGGISYDFENGWGANVGVSATQKSTNMSAGGSLNFQEGAGFTGAGLNIGYQGENGYGGTIGASVDRYGAFSGANVGGSFTGTHLGGTGRASVAMRIGADGKYAGTDISYTNTIERALDAGAANPFRHFFGNTSTGYGSTGYVIGGGLSFNSDHSFGVNSILGVSMTDDYRMGLHGLGANQNSSVNFDKDGNFTGTQTNIDLQMRFQTRQAALAQIQKDIHERKLSAADVAKLRDQINVLVGDEKKIEWAAQRREKIKTALAEKCGGACSDTDIDLILAGKHDTISLDQAIHDTATLFKDTEKTSDTSRTNILQKITGFIGDGIDSLFLNKYSEEAGFIDPEDGEWTPRTCFVKGTLVKTANGFKRIEEIRIGDTVASFNEHSGRIEYHRVTETFIHPTNLIYKLTYRDGTTVETTWNHPFYIEGRGWILAEDLRAGMESVIGGDAENGFMALNEPEQPQTLRMASFGTRPSLKGLALVSIERITRDDTVYNIEVDGNHTYFVTEREIGVHNYQDQWDDPENPRMALRRDLAAPSAQTLERMRRTAAGRYILDEFIDGMGPGLSQSEMLEKAEEAIRALGKYLTDSEKAAILKEAERRIKLSQLDVPSGLMDDIGRVRQDGTKNYFFAADGTPLGGSQVERGVESVFDETVSFVPVLGATARAGSYALRVGGKIITQKTERALLNHILSAAEQQAGKSIVASSWLLTAEQRTLLRAARNAVGSNARGKAGEEFLRALTGGEAAPIRITAAEMQAAARKLGFNWNGKPTRRFVDSYVDDLGRTNSVFAHEAKNYGSRKVALSSVREQLARELAIKAKDSSYKPVWHFLGKGPDKALRQQLKANGIPYVVWY